MSATHTEVQNDDAQIVSIYFPRGETQIISDANEKLLPKGYSRNFILLEAVRLGLPKVVKKYETKPAPSSFTDQVLRTVLGFSPKEDITTQVVTQALEAQDPELKSSNPSGFDNISKVLERLGDRQILASHGTAGRKKVWRLAIGPREVRRLLEELDMTPTAATA